MKFTFRTLLLGLLSIALIAGVGYVIYKGFDFKILNVYSVSNVYDNSNTLNKKLDEANEITTITYNSSKKELNDATTEFKNQKTKYENTYQSIGAERLAEILTQDRHEAEYIWARVGNYARENNVQIVLELKSGSRGMNGETDLEFTVDGTYRNITNFVYDVENDDSLSFKIEDFKLLPMANQNDENNNVRLRATFVVRGIYVLYK